MKTSGFIILVLLLFSFSVSGQNYYDNNWLLSGGNGAAIINFSRGFPKITTDTFPIIFEGASASISNIDGEIQFYTNGCSIYNAQNLLIENGDNINPGFVNDNWCDEFSGYPNVKQSTLIVPWPQKIGQYLILHQTVELYDEPTDQLSFVEKFLSTTVDMSANGGLGKVVDKNTLVDLRLYEAGGQALNRHANGIDWWLVSPLRDTNQYAVYLIDSAGIELESIQTIGNTDSRRTRGGGQSIFNPFGDKFMRYVSVSGLQIFDFDRSTGELSNFEFVEMPAEYHPDIGFGGMGVSPNGRFAYVSTFLKVHQYDLTASDIAASRVLVAELIDRDSSSDLPSSWNFQLGPDCKLYNYDNSGSKFHIIHSPNEKGLACDYRQEDLVLPYPFFRDQPYFPNSRLGPLGNEGSPCAEPLIVSNRDPEVMHANYLTVYPNPSAGDLRISLNEALPHTDARWTLFDVRGNTIRTVQPQGNEPLTVQLAGLPAGMYFWRLSSGADILQRGKIVLVD